MTTTPPHKTVRGADGISRCTRCGAAAARESALLLLSCTGEAEPEPEPEEKAAHVLRDVSEPVMPPVGVIWRPSPNMEPFVFVQFPDKHFNWVGMHSQRERFGQMAFPGIGMSADVRTVFQRLYLSEEFLISIPDHARVLKGEMARALYNALDEEKRYPVAPATMEIEHRTGFGRNIAVTASVPSVLLPDDLRYLIIPVPEVGEPVVLPPPAPL